jgi:hypothetical protein
VRLGHISANWGDLVTGVQRTVKSATHCKLTNSAPIETPNTLGLLSDLCVDGIDDGLVKRSGDLLFGLRELLPFAVFLFRQFIWGGPVSADSSVA